MNTALYLKASALCLQRDYVGSFEMPMRLGFRWFSVWTASSVKTWKNPFYEFESSSPVGVGYLFPYTI